MIISDNDEIEIVKILDMLGDRGIQSLLIEGGKDTWIRFLKSGLVDKAQLCVSNLELDGESGEKFDSSYLIENGLELSKSFDIEDDNITIWIKKSK